MKPLQTAKNVADVFRRVPSMSRLVLLLVWLVQICRPQDIFPEKDRNNRLPKTTAGLSWQVLNINNLWTWHR